MPSMSWQKILGVTLVALGLIGFMVVADDLRHQGEILGVGTILVAGVFLLDVGTRRLIFRRPAMQWIALGLLAGVAAGAGIDNMPSGIGFGAALGLVVAWARDRIE